MRTKSERPEHPLAPVVAADWNVRPVSLDQHERPAARRTNEGRHLSVEVASGTSDSYAHPYETEQIQQGASPGCAWRRPGNL
jgi:hypothetical protein